MPKNKLTIGLDLEKLKTLNSGLGQFGLHLTKELIENKNENSSFKLYLPDSAHSFFPNEETIYWKRIHQYTKVPAKVDIWHSIHQEAKYFPKKYQKLVLTIHDLNFLDKYSGSKRDKKLSKLQQLVDRADGVTFISNFTKKVANEHLNFGEKPQKVIYNGLTLNNPDQKKQPDYNLKEQPFLFSIGILSKKKNFHVLVSMMKALPEMNLIIAGNNKTDYANSIQEIIKKENLNNRVLLLGEVSEQEKNWLYQNCKAFLFPSLSEGFGLPVIESFYFGKPTILSTYSSLPEIGSGHAHYFDSFEPEAMADKVIEAIENHTESKQIEMKNYSISFSWKSAAISYIEFYNHISR